MSDVFLGRPVNRRVVRDANLLVNFMLLLAWSCLFLLFTACAAKAPTEPERKVPAPTVSVTVPAPDSSTVAPGTHLTVRFSQPIDPAVATSGALEVLDAQGALVPGTLAVADSTVTFTPTADLAFDAHYTATVSTRLIATNGKALVEAHSWNFTTTKRPLLRLFAGSLTGAGSEDGSGGSAWFNSPKGMVVDSEHNIFVADSGNHTIRKITPAGAVITWAGEAGVAGHVDAKGTAARFNNPTGMAIDANNVLYVTDTANFTLRKIIPDGTVTTLAGSAGVIGFADGDGADARFNTLQGVCVSAAGKIYVADTGNHLIRQINVSDTVVTVSTVAGLAGTSGAANGPNFDARFHSPTDVAVDADGNLFVADSVNNSIRKIAVSGGVTTIAGEMGKKETVDGIGVDAHFNRPSRLLLTADFLYIAEADGHIIRRMDADGLMTTLAGKAGEPGSADGEAVDARFNVPASMAKASDGAIYITDSGNHTIRKLTLYDGIVSTLAGTSARRDHVGGSGAAARFNSPVGLATDTQGNVFVADYGNARLRKITPEGGVTSLAEITGANSIATDAAGNIYVADLDNSTIKKVTKEGVVTTLADSAAAFSHPQGIAVDTVGNVYVADSDHHVIRKISTNGAITLFAGAGIAGSADAVGVDAKFNSPRGLAIGTDNTLYVADTNNHVIRKITMDGTVSTVAGSAGNPGSVDASGVDARFSRPQAVAIDGANAIYVADTGNNLVRKIRTDGEVTTLLGTVGKTGFDASATPGVLSKPVGLAVSGRTLYVSLYDGVAVLENLPE